MNIRAICEQVTVGRAPGWTSKWIESKEDGSEPLYQRQRRCHFSWLSPSSQIGEEFVETVLGTAMTLSSCASARSSCINAESLAFSCRLDGVKVIPSVRISHFCNKTNPESVLLWWATVQPKCLDLSHCAFKRTRARMPLEYACNALDTHAKLEVRESTSPSKATSSAYAALHPPHCCTTLDHCLGMAWK